MVNGRDELEEIYYVDKPDLQLGKEFAQESSGGK